MQTQIKNRLLALEAERWLGIQEEGGNNRGQIVRLFQSHMGGSSGAPWCMSFVQYCCHWVDRIGEIIGLMEPSRLHKSDHCMTVWNNTPNRSQLPFIGSVVIWNVQGTSSGHTGIVVGIDQKIITTIEGNTTDSSSRIVSEGDGVYKKRRPLESIGSLKLMGFLSPWRS